MEEDDCLLPEMPFCDWKMFMSRDVDSQLWQKAIAVHDEGILRLGELGQAGAQLIAALQATDGHRRWLLAAQMAAVIAGGFVASANRRSCESDTFSGGSWLISTEGEVLAQTSPEEPFVTTQINLAEADAAKRSYPRNIYVA
jgi:predicted amidohydrolase